MIIWIASYPKSGNTWLRSFLSMYLNNTENDFNFNLLGKIKSFPNTNLLRKFKIDGINFIEIAKKWIDMQEYINLNDEVTYLKTHNLFCTLENKYKFTNKQNTIGMIYIVRDPRDIVVSYTNHFNKKNFEETFKTLKTNFNYEIKNNVKISLMGSWADHYNSWKNFNISEKIIIKYENMVEDPVATFTKIIIYLNKIYGLKVDQKKIIKCTEKTKFETLQNLEKKEGFKEKPNNVKNFFRKGKVGEWKDVLDKNLKYDIEKIFFREMQELGYVK